MLHIFFMSFFFVVVFVLFLGGGLSLHVWNISLSIRYVVGSVLCLQILVSDQLVEIIVMYFCWLIVKKSNSSHSYKHQSMIWITVFYYIKMTNSSNFYFECLSEVATSFIYGKREVCNGMHWLTMFTSNKARKNHQSWLLSIYF